LKTLANENASIYIKVRNAKLPLKDKKFLSGIGRPYLIRNESRKTRLISNASVKDNNS
jgi:hypothetical protein